MQKNKYEENPKQEKVYKKRNIRTILSQKKNMKKRNIRKFLNQKKNMKKNKHDKNYEPNKMAKGCIRRAKNI